MGPIQSCYGIKLLNLYHSYGYKDTIFDAQSQNDPMVVTGTKMSLSIHAMIIVILARMQSELNQISLSILLQLFSIFCQLVHM